MEQVFAYLLMGLMCVAQVSCRAHESKDPRDWSDEKWLQHIADLPRSDHESTARSKEFDGLAASSTTVEDFESKVRTTQHGVMESQTDIAVLTFRPRFRMRILQLDDQWAYSVWYDQQTRKILRYGIAARGE